MRTASGRKVFEVETDTSDNVIVHHITSQHNDTYYHTDTLNRVYNEVKTQFDLQTHVYLIVVDISVELIDDNCGVARYYGGPAVIPASGYCLTGDNSTTLIAHELGHAFNLEHDFRDETYFMSYGHTRRKFSSCAAIGFKCESFYLWHQRFFNRRWVYQYHITDNLSTKRNPAIHSILQSVILTVSIRLIS